jgi:hypothetical protein
MNHFTTTHHPTNYNIIITHDNTITNINVHNTTPNTHKTNLLNPTHLINKIHTILLTNNNT